MRIVFVGGGSGGHFYPLIAIADALVSRAKMGTARTPELYYFGPDPYDQGSLFSLGITYVPCPSGKMRRYFSIRNFFDVFKTLGGIFVALARLFIIYPDVVVSKGGYTSVPVVIGAWLLRIPIIIHESDAHPGRANILGGKLATYIAITYDDTASYFPSDKVALTGIPVRPELLAAPPPNARQLLGIQSEKPLILVLGGSQGAERVNDAVVATLRELLPYYEIIHQTGTSNERSVTDTARALVPAELLSSYHVRGFLDAQAMHAALSESSLVVSRSGSGSIYEISLHAKPSILIPIPEDISHDQRKNAYAYTRTGAGEVIEEKNLTPHLLAAEITRIIQTPSVRDSMSAAASRFGSRDAAFKIADALIAIATSHQ